MIISKNNKSILKFRHGKKRGEGLNERVKGFKKKSAEEENKCSKKKKKRKVDALSQAQAARSDHLP